MKNNNDIEKLNWVSKILIAVSLIFVLGSFFCPYIFTHFSIIDFTNKGEIGDTIGGIMNPFISIASVAIMFLAFYMQYDANKLQRKLFDEQIKNEKEQFKQEIDEQKKQFERNQFENQFFEMLKTHKENSNIIINQTLDIEQIGQKRIEKKGFEAFVKKIENNYREKILNNQKEDKKTVFSKIYSNCWEDSFGHYFRHLFMLVKFVVSKKFLTYEEQRSYLRILRASLSTYEQIFLFYNWLSGYATQWEDDKNKFFTDYRMIHNINPNIIINDFDIKKMYPFKEQLGNKARKEENREIDYLFEFEDW